MQSARSTIKGYILGSLAAISYGTNPLFALPLYAVGLTVSSVLFYRYAFATALLGLIMLCMGERFRLSLRDMPLMIVMGIMFALSSVFLFEAYNYMDVGLASTLLFVEPITIALILLIIFKEKISKSTWMAIAVCMAGVGCLCDPGEGAHVTMRGVGYVMLSALSYSIYMVMISKSRIGKMPSMAITFYSLLFGMLVFAFTTRCFSQVQGVPTNSLVPWVCVAGISIFPTIVSLLTVAISIKCIGSVKVSILGALEPVTGIVIGVWFAHEILTPRAILGIVLILASVIVIITARSKRA